MQHMGKTEILAGLVTLRPAELAEVQAKLDELAGDEWLDAGDLSTADKASLNAALADYQAHPDAGRRWDEVRARIEAKLRP